MDSIKSVCKSCAKGIVKKKKKASPTTLQAHTHKQAVHAQTRSYLPVVCQMGIVLDVRLACCSVLLSLSIKSCLSLRLAAAVCVKVKRTKEGKKGERDREEGSMILLSMRKTHASTSNIHSQKSNG